jgi:phosphoribosylanthranilate isomerase
MFIKICGITREQDASAAVEAGATALGFVFWPRSPRYVDPAAAAGIIRALPQGVTPVGVFVNQPVDEIEEIARRTGIRLLQLHGDEPASYTSALTRPVMKAMTLRTADAFAEAWPAGTLILLDAHDPVRRGGTGRTVDWAHAARIAVRRPVVLAGGLTPDTVQDAIAAVQPYGVDVSSGVEASPGIKDSEKMRRFLEQVRLVRHG